MSEYNRHFNAIIVGRGDGSKQNPYNYYKLTSTFRPSIYDLRKAQADLGFPHEGYGVPEVVDTDHNRQTGRYITRWRSAASCD